jgi:hypothetical protein
MCIACGARIERPVETVTPTTWRGIGDIVVGMARQEYDLELRRYNGRGWRAMFFQSGFEHS